MRKVTYRIRRSRRPGGPCSVWRYDRTLRKYNKVRDADNEDAAKYLIRVWESKSNSPGVQEPPGADRGATGLQCVPRGLLIPWLTAVQSFLDRPLTPSSRVRYASVLALIERRFGLKVVSDLRRDDVKVWLAELRDTHKPATVSCYLRTLRTFIGWAYADDPDGAEAVITTRGPHSIIGEWKPYRKRPSDRAREVPESEFARLMDACDATDRDYLTPAQVARIRTQNQAGVGYVAIAQEAGTTEATVRAVLAGRFHNPAVKVRKWRDGLWWRAFLTLLYRSGLRVGEASHLRWADVDWERGVVSVRKHDAAKGIFAFLPKGKRSRMVPVPDEVLELLLRLQARQAEGVPYVFLNRPRYLELCALPKLPGELLPALNHRFNALCKRAGMVPTRLHDMRHSCVTQWLRRGLGVDEVRLLAGHADLQTTLNIYDRMEAEERVERARRIIRRIEPQPDGPGSASGTGSRGRLRSA